VFAELDGICPETTVLASNTSALSVSEMGSATKRPGKVIGMHFFNPAHVMKLIEVIPGLETAQDTTDDVVMFAESLRKLPVIVRECPGFLVNRLLGPFLNEATYCLEEGAASASDIDEALRDFGMPMGAFILSDTVGLDIATHAGEEMHREYGARMELPQLMYRLIDAGRLGEKAGKGIYGYGGEDDADIAEIAADLKKEGSVFTPERVMYPMINEAVIALTEHIANQADIDMACVAGLGMTYKGERKGPLAIADEIGLDCVLEELEALQKQYGERFRPAWLLRQKVSAGHLGVKAGRGFHEYA
jgi:3-hydroxyacyl-CoA dehydrogenase / enoyl-CoA hydratase / 3-hydroxybutyryl-CoA epimerase